MFKVSIIIPTWNGKELLETCLKSLKQQTFKDFEVIVVDNGSTDGTQEMIKKIYPKAVVLSFEKNKGFAPAVNEGIKNAQGDYLVLLNNDTKMDKECLKYLVKATQKKNVGLVAAKMLNFYSPETIDSAGAYITSVGHANGIGWKEKDGPAFNQAQEVFLASGGGCLIKKEVIKKIGLFDEDYFAYFEDVDFSLRAQLQGFKIWYQPKAIIYHVHKATSRRIQPFTEYLQFRNMTMTIMKDFPHQFLKQHWWKILLVNLHTVWFLMRQGYGKAAIQAELYVILHFWQILSKRKEIQKKNKLSFEDFARNVVTKKLHLFGVEF